jgi:nucleoside-diphosphate-sugar epimerase
MFLVTGASGFVGKGLQETLRQREIRFRSTSRHAHNGNVVVCNIDSHTDWSDALKGVDVVVHLAAVNQNVVQGRPATRGDFWEVNVEGTMNLAGQAVAAGVKRFIYLSSVKVNGEWTARGKPFTSSDTPSPQTAYAASKLEAERCLRTLSVGVPLETVILRPPLVYGRGVQGSFAALARLVAKRVPLPLRSIRNRRSMIYLENLTDLIVTAASHPSAAGKTFMAGDLESPSTPELLKLVAAASGGSCHLLPCPPILLETAARAVGKQDLVYRLTRSLEVDTSETRRLLDWTPPFQMPNALAVTLSSMQFTKEQ